MSTEIESWKEEKQSAYLYRILSEVERGTHREQLFADLAKTAEGQASIWVTALKNKGMEIPEEFTPSLRARLVAQLMRRLGPVFVKQVLAATKVRGMSVYNNHSVGHEMPTLESLAEKTHRASRSGGNLRAAVFGLNDGLVSNASLILGVAAAATQNSVILISGVAGLLAGAFSMAAGEYISVKSQRELFEYQIGLEREELELYPKEEAKELAIIYEAKGVARADAQRIADQMIADPTKALDTLAREELGLNPEDLGSPWGAAIFSFCSFALGAIVPLLPFMLMPGAQALWVMLSVSAVSLFLVGSALSLFTGRSFVYGGLRMLTIGAAAGCATYSIGKILGVTLN